MERNFQCEICERIDAAKLPCKHCCCEMCLIEDLKKKSSQKNLDEFECPKCSTNVYFEFVIAFFMTNLKYEDLFKKYFNCSVCENQKNNMIKLDCDHKICEDCLTNTVISLNEKKKNFADLACNICSIFIPPRHYNKYLTPEFTKEFFVPIKKEVQCYCKNCKKFAVASENFQFNCKYCKAKFCVCCLNEEHSNDCIFCVNKNQPEKKQNKIEPVKGKPLINSGNVKSKKINESSIIVNKNDKKSADFIQDLIKIQKGNQELNLNNFPVGSHPFPVFCSICKKKKGSNHGCDDLFCDDCFLSFIKKQIESDPISKVKCTCGNNFPEPDIIESFGGEEAYYKFKQKSADEIYFGKKPEFSCGICLVKFSIEEFVTFECEHRYCERCIREYFIQQIMSSNVSEEQLCCPQCQRPIDHNIIKGYVTPEMFEKYLNFALRNWQPEAGAILKICLHCNVGTEIPIDLKRFKCPYCKKEYCPQCNKVHMPEISCEDFENQQQRKEEVKKFKKANQGRNFNNQIKNEELKKKDENLPKRASSALPGPKNGKKVKEEEKKISKAEIAKKNEALTMELLKDLAVCPKCKNGVEKESGCNFMKCRWPGCKDSYFCLLCKKSLTVILIQIKDHYTHYQLSGPFGKTCNTLDNIKG